MDIRVLKGTYKGLWTETRCVAVNLEGFELLVGPVNLPATTDGLSGVDTSLAPIGVASLLICSLPT